MKTLGDRVVPLDPLHPDASTPPARADLPVPLPNIGKFTAKSTDEGRSLHNIKAQELARSPRWPDELDALLADADGSEMAAMCEGVDW